MTCCFGTNCWQQDIAAKEYMMAMGRGFLVFGGIVWLFYDSWIPLLLLPLFLTGYLKEWMKGCTRKKEEDFCGQFQESMRSMAASLRAGYSVENAFRETRRDLEMLYQKDVRILREFRYMVHQLDMNVSMDQVLKEFAQRIPQEDVVSFAAVFTASGKAGGDSISVIQNTVKTLCGKMEVRQEIQTLIAAKRLEFRVMTVVPFGIIFYMRISFREFMNVLYGNAVGAAIMSGCLVIYFAAWILGQRIVEIEI